MIQTIPIDKIIPHPRNPRQAVPRRSADATNGSGIREADVLNLGDLSELAESIKARGILQNLTVVPITVTEEVSAAYRKTATEKSSVYMVVIGHRRLAAAKLAGLAEVPCAVVDMDEKTQISTMLLENMQRSDLTVYEQAQGMQMMLDLGETVNTISEKTGFSETTVRRRVKLLDLDKDKFREAAERGGTLEDYAELDKIKSPELRNEVLATVGTKNFKWRLEAAVEGEEMDVMRENFVKELRKWAEELDGDGNGDVKDLTFVTCVLHSKNRYNNFEPPEDCEDDELKYFFVVNDRDINIYTDKPGEHGENEEEDTAAAELEERVAKLDELALKAYKLRMDFARKFKPNAKHINAIMTHAGLIMARRAGSLDRGQFADFIGVDEDTLPWHIPNEAERNGSTPARAGCGATEQGRETFSEAKNRVLNHDNMTVTEMLFVSAYLMLESRENEFHEDRCYVAEYGKHKYSVRFAMLYGLLHDIGYQISDEEKALADGTHELFGTRERETEDE